MVAPRGAGHYPNHPPFGARSTVAFITAGLATAGGVLTGFTIRDDVLATPGAQRATDASGPVRLSVPVRARRGDQAEIVISSAARSQCARSAAVA